MKALLAQIARLLPVSAATEAQPPVARDLMENAEARAGHDPQQAQELRSAAYAFLRVVR